MGTPLRRVERAVERGRGAWPALVSSSAAGIEPSPEVAVSRQTYTAIVESEDGGYVALCPELDVASQGDTVEEAIANLREAVDLFLECADPAEIARRTHSEIFITRFDATVG
jgi:predicted RNase H-like HicB family nuclease